MQTDPPPSATVRAAEPAPSSSEDRLPDGATPAALAPARLYRPTHPSVLTFQTTAELTPIDASAGQQRALGAIKFGTRMHKSGFNLFVVGSAGSRMQDVVQSILKSSRWDRPEPTDWVYVNNFEDARRPIAIQLPPGRAPELRDTMQEVTDDLEIALPALFESEDYQARRAAIDQTFQAKQGEAFAKLGEKAASANMGLLRTPMGFMIAPVRDGKVVPPDEFNAWSDTDRQAAQEMIDNLQQELEQIVRHIPSWEKAHREEIQKLDQQTALVAIDQSINQAKGRFSDTPQIAAYLDNVRTDLSENVELFVARPKGELGAIVGAALGNAIDRYHVNVLVSQSPKDEAVPIVQEFHPTLANLIGSIEHVSQNGFLVTNFLLIKAGALHRANGGFLLLDARHLLSEPFSWPALKRMLRQREIRIEDVTRFVGLTSSVSLEPDAIPLDLKVIIFGDRLLYYLLSAYDPEIGEFFKILADFEDDIERTLESEATHARLIASLLAQEQLKPVDRDGVGLVLEHAARLADDSGKLTLLTDRLKDLLAEADFWANEAKHQIITRADVQRALDENVRRMSRMRDRAQDAILRDIALIDTVGKTTGQVNGLSVLELSGFNI